MKIQRLLVAASLISVLVLGSCKEDEDPAPAPTVVANAGPDQTIQSGATANLDASGSKDSEGADLTYSWAVIRKPEGSNPVLSSTTIMNPVFSPDMEGTYELELTVTSKNGSKKDNVVITVAYTPIVLSHITSRTVLEDHTINPLLPDYVVNDDIAVDAELVVKPGVVIAFAEDVFMQVGDEGILTAVGTADNKITFTGQSNETGYWRGIVIYSNASANELNHAEILNAGSSDLISGVKANITVTEGGRLKIKNSRVGGSKGYGIYYMDGSTITAFESNVISNNAEAPLLLLADHVSKLDYASSLSVGNGRNVVEVMTSFISGSSEVNWKGFNDGTPYRFLGTIVAQTGLNLDPGVTIEVTPNNYFEIGDGYLYAAGTADKKITFTGADKTASSWKGLIIYSQSNFNVMKYVDINYAGSDEIVTGVPAGIVLTHEGTLSILNSTISHSGGYGIFVNGSDAHVNADAETENNFISNAGDAIYYQN